MDEKSRNAGTETTESEDSPQKPHRSKSEQRVDQKYIEIDMLRIFQMLRIFPYVNYHLIACNYKLFTHSKKKIGRRTPSAEPSDKSDVKSKRRSRSHSRSRSASTGRSRRRRSRSRSPDRRWGRYEISTNK